MPSTWACLWFLFIMLYIQNVVADDRSVSQSSSESDKGVREVKSPAEIETTKKKKEDGGITIETEKDDGSITETEEDSSRGSIISIDSSYEDKSGSDNSDETSDSESNREKDRNKETARALQVGDTFTPQEMLVIAKKLMEKVENPGKGVGIISSAVNEQLLAELLFQMYFNTMQNIVTLKKYDIPGLDALQALAMSGSEVNEKDFNYFHNEKHKKKEKKHKKNNQCSMKLAMKYLKKQGLMFKKPGPTKNKFRRGSMIEEMAKNLAKNRSLVIYNKRKSQGGIAEMAKHLAKNRSLVIYNKRRRQGDSVDFLHTPKRPNVAQANLGKNDYKNLKGKNCRWKYQCTEPRDQSTCHVEPDCTSASRRSNYIETPESMDIEATRRFLQKVGIEFVDEEVEKIVERHILDSYGSILGSLPKYKIENVRDFFDKILKLEENGKTRPLPNQWKTTVSPE